MYENGNGIIANQSDISGIILIKSVSQYTKPAHMIVASDSKGKLEESIRDSPKLNFLFKSVSQNIQSVMVPSLGSDGVSPEYHFVGFHLDKGLIPVDLEIVREFSLEQISSHKSFLDQSHYIMQEYFIQFYAPELSQSYKNLNNTLEIPNKFFWE